VTYWLPGQQEAHVVQAAYEILAFRFGMVRDDLLHRHTRDHEIQQKTRERVRFELTGAVVRKS